MLLIGVQKLSDYESYIFDMDGTLYFNPPVVLRMVLKMAGFYLIRPWRWHELFYIINYQSRERQGKLSVNTPCVKQWLITKPCALIARFADIELVEFIKEQHAQGKRIFVYSNFPTNDKVEALGLTQIIERQFFPAGPNSAVAYKPNKKGMDYIIEQTGIKVEKTIFLGDKKSTDGASAASVGMACLILPRNKTKRRKRISYE